MTTTATTTTTAQPKHRKRARIDPLLSLWIGNGQDSFWLSELSRGAITPDDVSSWLCGEPIPPNKREIFIATFRAFLDAGITMLGREAVRNTRFALSPNFLAWSAKMTTAQNKLDALLKKEAGQK